MQAFILSLLISSSVFTDTLHQQTAYHEVSPVRAHRGVLMLTDEGVHFQAWSRRKQHRNFFLDYDSIQRVRRAWWYLAPNRITIKMHNGKRYTIYSWRRKEMFRLISARIEQEE